MARLLRHKAQPAVLDVLTAQSHDVAAAYPQIKQEGKREPRLGADGMPSLELSDLIDTSGQMNQILKQASTLELSWRPDGM